MSFFLSLRDTNFKITHNSTFFFLLRSPTLQKLLPWRLDTVRDTKTAFLTLKDETSTPVCLICEFPPPPSTFSRLGQTSTQLKLTDRTAKTRKLMPDISVSQD